MKLYSNVTIIFCIWALCILTVFYFGYYGIHHSGLFANSFIKNLGNWDGGHYLGIADGYDQAFQYAFFPFYPLLINLVSKITGNFLSAGILISVISTFLAFQIFYNLVLLEFGKSVAQKSLLALIFFPMSFYFLTVYTEGLFFLLVVSTFFLARKGNILLATITASLASATRLAGLGVVLGLFINLYFLKSINKRNWFILFAPLGFILYCVYLYNQTGDPLYFIRAESYWHRNLVLPGSALVESFKELFQPNFIALNFSAFFDFLFTIFGIVMIWKVWKRLSIDYAVFSIFSLLLPLSSPTIIAIPRYLLTIFPIFIILGFYKNQYLILFYQIFSLMLLATFAVFFIAGYWVS